MSSRLLTAAAKRGLVPPPPPHTAEQLGAPALAGERGACPDAADFGFEERFSYKTSIQELVYSNVKAE